MALSANTLLPIRNTMGLTILNQVVKTSSVIYHHALACQNAAGTVVPAANSTTMTFLGLAVIDNPSVVGPGITGDGTLRVTTVSDIDVQISLKTTVTVGMVGAIMYAFDDAQATNLNTLGPEIGTLVEFTSANLGWVRIRGEQITKAS